MCVLPTDAGRYAPGHGGQLRWLFGFRAGERPGIRELERNALLASGVLNGPVDSSITHHHGHDSVRLLLVQRGKVYRLVALRDRAKVRRHSGARAIDQLGEGAVVAVRQQLARRACDHTHKMLTRAGSSSILCV